MSRLEKLKELESELKGLMARANSRSFAALSREYRAVIAEIEELEGDHEDDDPIARLVARHEGQG